MTRSKKIKTKVIAEITHLADDQFYIKVKLPKLGLHKSYQFTCKDNQATHRKLRHPANIVRIGNQLVVDFAQDKGKVHIEHKLKTNSLLGFLLALYEYLRSQLVIFFTHTYCLF